jgi:hypothetical protein
MIESLAIYRKQKLELDRKLEITRNIFERKKGLIDKKIADVYTAYFDQLINELNGDVHKNLIDSDSLYKSLDSYLNRHNEVTVTDFKDIEQYKHQRLHNFMFTDNCMYTHGTLYERYPAIKLQLEELFNSGIESLRISQDWRKREMSMEQFKKFVLKDFNSYKIVNADWCEWREKKELLQFLGGASFAKNSLPINFSIEAKQGISYVSLLPNKTFIESVKKISEWYAQCPKDPLQSIVIPNSRKVTWDSY